MSDGAAENKTAETKPAETKPAATKPVEKKVAGGPEFEHNFLDRPDGTRFHYVAYGPTNGEAAVFVHGFPEFWYTWRHVMKLLANEGKRTIAIDMRGFGQTVTPADEAQYIANDRVADDIVAALDNEEIHKAHIVGHDWGSMPTWLTARIHKNRFKSVTSLLIPHFTRVGTVEEFAGALPQFKYQLIFVRNDRQDVTAELLEDPRRSYQVMFHWIDAEGGAGLPTDPEGRLDQNTPYVETPIYMTSAELDEYVANVEQLEHGWPGMLAWYLNDVRAIDNQYLDDNNVPDYYEIPVFMVTAERDNVLPPYLSADIDQYCRAGLRRAHAERSGHWVSGAQPEWLVDQLVDFWKDVNCGKYEEEDDQGDDEQKKLLNAPKRS